MLHTYIRIYKFWNTLKYKYTFKKYIFKSNKAEILVCFRKVLHPENTGMISVLTFHGFVGTQQGDRCKTLDWTLAHVRDSRSIHYQYHESIIIPASHTAQKRPRQPTEQLVVFNACLLLNLEIRVPSLVWLLKPQNINRHTKQKISFLCSMWSFPSATEQMHFFSAYLIFSLISSS